MVRTSLALSLLLLLSSGCGSRRASSTSDGGPLAEPDCDTPFSWPVDKRSISIPPSEAWKPTLELRHDRFVQRVPNGLGARWARFAIFVADPTKVYFQDSRTFYDHYRFASQHLPPFQGLSRAEFDDKTLRESGQEAVLGAVLIHPERHTDGSDVEDREYGIVFERREAYHPEMVRILYELVRSKLVTHEKYPFQGFYFPSYQQQSSAQRLESCYAKKGITVSSEGRWRSPEQCYSPGWALGRLTQVASDDVDKAYAEGRLLPSDILLTDAVPARLPLVAGVISLSPVSPDAPAVTRALSLRVPLVYLRDKAAVEALTDKEVIVRVPRAIYCRVDVVSSEGLVDSALKKKILARKAIAPLRYTPKARSGAISRSAHGLTAADIRSVGGRAASMGLLRATLPMNSPGSVVFTFDLWDAFMAQTTKSGKSLADEIEGRLKGFAYPPDMARLSAALEGIRRSIKNETRFDLPQRWAIMGSLSPFDAKRPILFRSSTNVEDLESFVGIGLYESHRGCLRDDQDSDDDGPSHCAADEPMERGVFDAIRKVYASFYNVNAYLERLRRKVDERQVGVALLVHQGLPEAEVMANGRVIVSGTSSFDIRTQAKTYSVTDPDVDMRAERVLTREYANRTGLYHQLRERSSLVSVGTTVLRWTEDYEALVGMLQKVARAFARAKGESPRELHVEYVKVEPGKFVITGLRELPRPNYTEKVVPFLLGRPLRLCSYQGDSGDVFANHRLKSRWTLTLEGLELTEAARKTIPFSSIDLEWLEDGVISHRSGDPRAWSEASAPSDDRFLRLRFAHGSGPHKGTTTLNIGVPAKVTTSETPLLFLRDLYGHFFVRKTYAQPVRYFGSDHDVKERSSEAAALFHRCGEGAPAADEQLQTRNIKGPDNLVITSSFYWPPHPTGNTTAYALPVIRWVETKIEGLTTQPLVLTGYYSQSYNTEFYNDPETFIFEPGLSEELSRSQRDALAAKNIRAIYVKWWESPKKAAIKLIGLDGTIRDP